MNRTRLGRLSIALLALMIPAATAAFALPQSGASAADPVYMPQLKVMTYNIHHEAMEAPWEARLWSTRKDEALALITAANPPLLTVQEATHAQSDDIAALGYSVFPGFDVPGDQQTPHQIYWKTGRLAQVTANTTIPHKWVLPLSDVCNSASLAWTLLKDKYPAYAGGANTIYLVATTHLSSACSGGTSVSGARTEQAQMIMFVLAALRDQLGSLPIILTGDMNAQRPSCVSGTYNEQTLPTLLTKNGFFTLLSAVECVPPTGKPFTHNEGWDNNKPTNNDHSQVDFVLHDKAAFTVASFKVDTTMKYKAPDTLTNVSPSDHYPVIATLTRQ